MNERVTETHGIAIIGMAGRFPGAGSVDELWANLLAARETITRLDPATLADGEAAADADYVPCRGLIDRGEDFDAGFFGMSRIEAEVTDPQQRLFLESAWTALEHAGYDPRNVPGLTGVWAGTGNNHYFLKQLSRNRTLLDTAGSEAVMIGNEKDYVAARVAYKLNLRGPAINVVTACSTSLVAVCQAVQALMTYQCDVALAGGASLRWPQNRGYLHEEGGIFSPDGHCRAFDERSAGTVFSSGCGCVVLKRVGDAIRDGDTVYAVIKGAAINNDGSGRVSFTAPGVDGQSENIAMALALADVPPRRISYVEAHGTGTALGDVIEVAALTQAFRAGGDDRVQECGLGSLKTATGHMDAAAGVGGLIKTALALHHRIIPSTLHFQRPNPRLGLEQSPFKVIAKAEPWSDGDEPRCAMVAALGVGGTNAHVVLESWRERSRAREEESPTGPQGQLIVVSGRSAEVTVVQARNLADHLEANRALELADISHTLALGRTRFSHRIAVAADSTGSAILKLRAAPKPLTAASDLRIAFLFPGQGSQRAGMGAGIEESFPLMRDELARCREGLGFDPLCLDDAGLAQTENAQPALFCLGYALARLYQSWGIEPQALVGHSIGEFVAATLAGVFSLDDALRLVRARGRAMQQMPAGVMLAVRCGEDHLDHPPSLDLAAVNGPELCVVSGPEDEIARYETALAQRGIGARRLRTSHAFHSRMMDAALPIFRSAFDGIKLDAPRIPIFSNVTGAGLTADEATSPDYWISQLRSTVRFATALREVRLHVCLELGPGDTATRLARLNGVELAFQSLGVPQDGTADNPLRVLDAAGRLWCAGAELNWEKRFESPRRRVALPTYPFERQCCCPEFTASAGGEDARSLDDDHTSEPTVDKATHELSSEPPRPSTPASRRDNLLAELHAQFLRISGVDTSAHPASTPLLDLGFDSLFLTQAGTALKKHFGVKITFRQLMEELTSVEALADYLDAGLPPDRFQPVAVAPVAQSLRRTAPRGSDEAASEGIEARLSRIEEALARLTGEPAASSANGPEAFMVTTHSLKGSEGQKISFGPFRPVEKGADGSLSERQRAHLDRLIADYCSKYPRTREFTSTHRQHFADPRAVAGFNPLWKEMVFPAVVDRSEGAFLWDIDGHEWVDVVHGFGSGFFGHRPQFVIDALKAQLDRGIEIGPTHPLAGEVAELVKEFSGLDRVAFCNTGSEALMAALRVARTVTGRDRIAMFAGSYHGIFDEVLARPLVSDGRLSSIPVAPGIPGSAVQNIIVLEYGHPESLEIIERHGHELAAVLVEPVPSRRPDVAPVEFVQRLRAITKASGTAMVFDEVVLGFRTHARGAQHFFGIEADLVAYGKVIGGGLPLGILAGARAFMDALDGGAWEFGNSSAPEVGVTFFAGTFIRHPLALAAAKAVLVHLKEQGPELQRSIDATTERFVGRLNAIFEAAAVPVKVTRFSSLWMLNADPSLKFFGLLFYHLRLGGVHIWEGRGNFVSTAHDEPTLDRVLDAFRESVAALQDGGFFPSWIPADLSTTTRDALRPDGSGVSAGSPTTTAGVPGRPGGQMIPLTPEQQEILVASSLSPQASLAFHESVTLRLTGQIEIPRLERSLAALAARHAALRMCAAGDGIHQCVMPVTEPGPLRFIDADDRALEREFETPFDLSRAPLWRALLIRHGADRHDLVLTGHHLMIDGWSWGLIASDLGALHAGRELPPAPQFSDHARDREPDESAAAYWRGRFQAVPPVLELPVDRRRHEAADYSADTVSGALSDELVSRLRGFCRSQKVTPNVVLLTAWQVLLARVSGQWDLVIGTPMAGQPAASSPGLVGHCVHFLPLRATLDPGMPAVDAVAQNRGGLIDATEHQNFTLGQLLPQLKRERNGERPTFVRNTFTVESVPAEFAFGPGVTAEFISNKKRRLLFDISLFVHQSRSGFRWQCVYQDSRFARGTIERWMRAYATLLSGIIEQPSTPLGRLPLMSADERDTVLRTWNESGCPPPPAATIHALVADIARTTPEAVAVTFGIHGEESLRYCELDWRANQLAHELIARGVRRGELVAVFAERSLELMVALLAILKAGAAYAPIDPAYPRERIEIMIEDMQARIVLTQRRLNRKFDSKDIEVIDIDAAPNPFAAHLQTPPEVDVGPDDLAYVVYTSGSTGRPKGVAVPHRAVVRLVRHTNFASLDASEVWLQLAPLPFDASTLEIWGPLCNGGRVAVMTPGSPSLAEIGGAIHESGVSSLWLTAGLFQLMVDERLDDLAPLRQLLTGGDVVSPRHARMVLDRFPAMRLINGYGPTENTTFTTCHTITRADLERPSLPIGTPVAQTRVYVLDNQFEPSLPGVAGELFAAGDGLAQGYWQRDNLTRERFIEHEQFGRLYRTGDLVRWLPEGVIEFIGRLDNQAKVRGFRIEPGEIESQLASHPGVRQCVVAILGDDAGGRRLVAFHVPAHEGVTPAELREFLRARLPDYLVPAEFVAMPGGLPLNANGKVDLSSLPEPSRPATPSRRTVEPRTPIEQRLFKLWQEALGRNSFGVTDNFFDLGGDSLRGLRLFTRIEREFGRPLPLGTLFAAPTIEKLAEILEGPRDRLPSIIVPIQPAGTKRGLFCVHGGDGGIVFYRGLAAGLGSTRPFYGIEAPMLTNSALSGPEDSLEKTAAVYLSALREVQPEGPYLLGGYSFGGLVAYEMAQQLRQNDESVGLLALFDTDNPSVPPRYFNLAERLTARWRMTAADGSGLSDRLARLGGRLTRGLAARRQRQRDVALVESHASAGARAPESLRRVEVREAHAKLADAYRPLPYEGSLVLFRSAGETDKFEHSRALGWEDLVRGRIDVIDVPGVHLEVFDPAHVSVLARKLREQLDRIDP